MLHPPSKPTICATDSDVSGNYADESGGFRFNMLHAKLRPQNIRKDLARNQ